MAEEYSIRKRNWALLATLALGAGAFVLGWIGHAQHYQFQEPKRLDMAYMSLQLFALNGDVAGDKPMALEVARFVAPGVTAAALLLTVLALFREQAQRLWLRLFWRKHVVICGLGRMGMQLLRELRAGRRRRVVAIERQAGHDAIAVARQMGAIVLVGDATDQFLLEQACLGRAAELLITCGDDRSNVEIAVRACKIKKDAGGGGKLRAFVHIADVCLCDLFKYNRVFMDVEDQYEVSVFNLFQNAARNLFANYPLDRVPIGPDDPRQVHLIILGLGAMGQGTLLQAARIAQFANGKLPRITAIDAGASSRVDQLRMRYPQLSRAAQVEFILEDVASPRARDFLEEAADDDKSIVTIVVASDDEEWNVTTAVNLPPACRRRAIPVLVHLREKMGMATLLEEGNRSDATMHVRPFGTVEDACSVELVMRQRLDQLAREIQRAYVESVLRDNGGTIPEKKKRSAQPWDKLEEEFRDSCRQQADHYPVKLRAIGCRALSEDRGEGQKVEQFTAKEVEIMAKMEHARWNAERFLAGWKPGPKRDDANRVHDCLVSWEDLPEPIRQYDRDPMSKIPERLGKIGWGVYRVGGGKPAQ